MCQIGLFIPLFTDDSVLTESMRTISCICLLSFFEAVQRRTCLTAYVSIDCFRFHFKLDFFFFNITGGTVFMDDGSALLFDVKLYPD